MSDKKIYALSKVTKSIQNLIAKNAGNYIWIKAEIVKLNYYSYSGHCYPDLVEKKDNKIIAEMRGNIWSSNFTKINEKFKSVLNESLGDNMTVVFLANVQFKPTHGLSLNIIDIDPSYTLGELARQKLETIKKLKAAQIFDLNKQKRLPSVPKTIAIISVETSKGYQDFINIIEHNSSGFTFHHLLFPAILQGDKAVDTITYQLNQIAEYQDVFDAVAIIRGGGGEVGLSCFDSYELARAIATYPLPILTGIGHATNETVAELVSFKSFITPTKIAEFLLQEFHNFLTPLNHNINKINNIYKNKIEQQKTDLKGASRLFASFVQRIFAAQKSDIKQYEKIILNYSPILLNNENKTLKNNAKYLQMHTSDFIQSQNQLLQQVFNHMKNQNEKVILHENRNLLYNSRIMKNNAIATLNSAITEVEFIQEKLNILNPVNVLKRGFSITRINGKSVQNANNIKIGDTIETELLDGKIESMVEKLKLKTIK